MLCPRCGSDNDDGNDFCENCGRDLSEALPLEKWDEPFDDIEDIGDFEGAPSFTTELENAPDDQPFDAPFDMGDGAEPPTGGDAPEPESAPDGEMEFALDGEPELGLDEGRTFALDGEPEFLLAETPDLSADLTPEYEVSAGPELENLPEAEELEVFDTGSQSDPGGIPKINSHIVGAILSAIFCMCLPLGIPAIVFAVECEKAINAGNYDAARRFSRRAGGFISASIIISLALVAIAVLLIALAIQGGYVPIGYLFDY